MTLLSVLDLAPIKEGGDAAVALAESASLAQAAERAGYNRFWLAEHHNMPGIASAATAVVIGHVAAATKSIRVGAGGVMLPNHAPYVIAEQFGTLATLFPGRIDLGLGRAPGTDQVTAYALRRTLQGDIDSFPRDVVELQTYLGDPQPNQRIHAFPGEGTKVPIWILGSSTYGAQLAAMLGLPYAFASHFAPGELENALAIYRRTFKPSAQLDKPYVMLGCSAYAADTEEEARYLASSMAQAFVNLRTGNPGKMPKPREGYVESLPPEAQAMLRQTLSASFVGAPDQVGAGLAAFAAKHGADELMVTCGIHDAGKRARSYELAMSAFTAAERGRVAA